MIVHADQQFLQVIEGEKPVVRQLFGRVYQDPRHESIMTLFDGSAPHRLFPEWSLGLNRVVSVARLRLAGYLNPQHRAALVLRSCNDQEITADLLGELQEEQCRAERAGTGFGAKAVGVLDSPSLTSFTASVYQQLTPASSNTREPSNTRELRNPRGKRLLYAALLLLTVFSGLVWHYNVDKTLTKEDCQYIQLLLPGMAKGSAIQLDYQGQVELVQRVQRAIIAASPKMEGIPEGEPREPKQLYLGRKGLCYDRSRVIEKTCIYLGFETRHVSLFAREQGVYPLITLLFHHVPSHAISEILTKKGWMLVDSNAPWLGLDSEHNPVSACQMAAASDVNRPVKWFLPEEKAYDGFYKTPCIYVYGLYSRHGRFYPPYTPYVPDYRLRGLLYNLERIRKKG